MNQAGKAIGSGIAGAAILTLVNEALRQFAPRTPKVENLGMSAIDKLLSQFSPPAAPSKSFHGQALVGDLLTNSLYYSLTGASKKPWMTGVLAGFTAGVAAVALPQQLGLEDQKVNRTPANIAMTIGLYTLGGVVAAGVARLLTEKIKNV